MKIKKTGFYWCYLSFIIVSVHLCANSYQPIIAINSNELLKSIGSKSIKIASFTMPQIAQADGHGLFWSILKQIFEPTNTQKKNTQIKTGIEMLIQEQFIDIFMGEQSNSETTILSYYPLLEISLGIMHSKKLDTDQLTKTIETPIMFYQYLPQPESWAQHTKTSVCTDLKQCIRNLKHQNSKALIFNQAQTKLAQLSLKGFQTTLLAPPLHIYWIFRNDRQGQALKKYIDLKLMALNQDGSLARLYDQWQQSLPISFLKQQQPDLLNL